MSDRVEFALPIQILGSDVDGHTYREETQTLLLSRNGALIFSTRNLTPQEEILIQRKDTGQESQAQVVGRVRDEAGGFVYGVKFLDPGVNLWNINFADLSEEERAVGRMLLQCSKCRQREVVYLDEVEIEVYYSNRHLYRTCPRCRESTIWNETASEAPRTKNERRHNRVNCRLRACIRYQWPSEEEVLEIKDVSRGGVSFVTRRPVTAGTKIEIAVPYSRGMANIFVPAEVVRVRPLPNTNLFECGAAYIKRN